MERLPDTFDSTGRGPWTAAWKIALVALGIRVAFMLLFGLPRPLPENKYEWDWGYEQIAVARSVAEGHGYQSPFLRSTPEAPWAAKETGATAWCGPVYPVLLAGLLRITDGPNHRMAWWLAVMNSILSASICIGLARIGVGLGRPRLGTLSAWAWAFHPGAAYFAVTLVWDSVFVAAGIVWFLAFLVNRAFESTDAPRRLVPVGLAFGALGLLNPSTLALAPGIALFFWVRSGKQGLRPLLAIALPCVLVLAPWSIRNQVQLGTLAPKANLGVELMVGNHGLAEGRFSPDAHPSYNSREHLEYLNLGEAAYARQARQRFQEWVRAHPGRFAFLTLTRIRHFWIGLSPFTPVVLHGGGLHERDWQGWVKWCLHFSVGCLALLGALRHRDERGGRALLVGCVTCFPLVYYVTHVMERYRFPIEPLLVMLAVSALLGLVGSRMPAILRGQ